jgi:hypothetical protein
MSQVCSVIKVSPAQQRPTPFSPTAGRLWILAAHSLHGEQLVLWHSVSWKSASQLTANVPIAHFLAVSGQSLVLSWNALGLCALANGTQAATETHHWQS